MREQDDRHDEQNPELPVPDNKADMRRRLRCAAFLTHHRHAGSKIAALRLMFGFKCQP
jgi:hypothetical protein